jgi:hypothetical protein
LLSAPCRTGSIGAALRNVGDLVKPPWNWRALVAIGTLGLPVLIAAALVSVTTNIPRYFIEHLLGIGELGTFAAIAYPMAVGITVINAIGQSAMPRLARQYADGNLQRFSELMLGLVGIATALGIGGVLLIQFAGRAILTVLYRPEYGNYISVFLWLGVGTGVFLISGILGYGVNAVRHFRTQMLISISVALVAAAACGYWSHGGICWGRNRNYYDRCSKRRQMPPLFFTRYGVKRRGPTCEPDAYNSAGCSNDPTSTRALASQSGAVSLGIFRRLHAAHGRFSRQLSSGSSLVCHSCSILRRLIGSGRSRLVTRSC